MTRLLWAIPLFLFSSFTLTVAQNQPLTLDDLQFNYVTEGANRWGVVEIVNGTHVLLPCSEGALPTSRLNEDSAKECLAKYIMLYFDSDPKREFRAISYEIVRLDYNDAAAQSMRVIAGPAGVDSENPDGGGASGGSCTIRTALAVGDGTIDCDETDADTVTITASGTNEYTGYGFTYQTQTGASDMQIETQVPAVANWSGHLENFTGAGVMLREGTGDNDYNVFCWRPNAGVIAYKVVENQALVSSGTGTAGTSLPRYCQIRYDDSASTIEIFESSDAATWSQVGTESKSLTFPVLYGEFVTSHANGLTSTIPLDFSAYSTTLDSGGDPPPDPPGPRDGVMWSADFENGVIAARSNGTADASATISQTTRVGGKTCNITGFTNANPAIISYSGCSLSNGDGLTIRNAGGITEANDQLVYVRSVGGGSFEAAVVNWPEFNGNGGATVASLIASLSMNSSSYGTYTSGGTLEGWNVISDAGGGFGTASGYESRVVTSTNTIGGDTNVSPNNGTYFFKNQINRNAPNFSNNKNKPRGTLRPANDAQVPHDAPFVMGFAIYAPSDLCADNNNQENMIMNFTANSASQDFFHLMKRGGSDDGNPNWYLEWGKNASSSNQSINEVLDLGDIELGAWTHWVIEGTINPSTGSLRVWKNVKGSDPVEVTNGDLPIVGTGFGNVQSGSNLNSWTLRQYAFPWRNQDTICTDETQEIGFDDIHIGLVSDGATFQHMHPDQASKP